MRLDYGLTIVSCIKYFVKKPYVVPSDNFFFKNLAYWFFERRGEQTANLWFHHSIYEECNFEVFPSAWNYKGISSIECLGWFLAS